MGLCCFFWSSVMIYFSLYKYSKHFWHDLLSNFKDYCSIQRAYGWSDLTPFPNHYGPSTKVLGHIDLHTSNSVCLSVYTDVRTYENLVCATPPTLIKGLWPNFCDKFPVVGHWCPGDKFSSIGVIGVVWYLEYFVLYSLVNCLEGTNMIGFCLVYLNKER